MRRRGGLTAPADRGEREWQQEGADPLLGILGVFNHLPAQMRVVTQLALLPASPTWSSPYLRKAVEHPLEQEHLRARLDLSGRQASGLGTVQLVLLAVLVALLLVWWPFQQQINAHLPTWVVQAALSLLHGKSPQLSPGQVSQLFIVGIIAFVALFCLAFLLMQMRSRLGGSSIYNRRLVEEKTARQAYRVRLRLFVFTTGPDQMVAINRPSWRALGRSLFQWPHDTSSWLQSYRSWGAASRQHALEWEARVQVLDQLAAAYRQYHTRLQWLLRPAPPGAAQEQARTQHASGAPPRLGKRRGTLISQTERRRPRGALALAAGP